MQPTSSSPTEQPTKQPTRQPSQPTSQPTRQPTSQPSSQPTTRPTQPSGQPTTQPTQPTSQPTRQPTSRPSREPTGQPTNQPSVGPPTGQPVGKPTGQPSGQPTSQPTRQPFGMPTGQPTQQPVGRPTGQPSRQPSSQPTTKPSNQPSRQPTTQPSLSLPVSFYSGLVGLYSFNGRVNDYSGKRNDGAAYGAAKFVADRYGRPKHAVFFNGTKGYLEIPSANLNLACNFTITFWMNAASQLLPSHSPSQAPFNGTAPPSSSNDTVPTVSPSNAPSLAPFNGSAHPSWSNTSVPTVSPSNAPSLAPFNGSAHPSWSNTSVPTVSSSNAPSPASPSTLMSLGNTFSLDMESNLLSISSNNNTILDSSQRPVRVPSPVLTWTHFVIVKNKGKIDFYGDSNLLHSFDTSYDSINGNENFPLIIGALKNIGNGMTNEFTRFFHGFLDELWIFNRALNSDEIGALNLFGAPTSQPSSQPSRLPSSQPSRQPFSFPTAQPSRQPTSKPTGQPSNQPSSQPSRQPSSQPTGQPSRQPSSQPTRQPSSRPSGQPSRQPSAQPSNQPSSRPTFRIVSTTLKEGLVAFYTFDGDANDNSGNANNGIISKKGVTYVQDRFKNPKSAVAFNGTAGAGYIEIAGQQFKLQNMTIAFWMKTNRAQISRILDHSCLDIADPTQAPTEMPSELPTKVPSAAPTVIQTEIPSELPTKVPSAAPTVIQTEMPSVVPTTDPSEVPSTIPTETPSVVPSEEPSLRPSVRPSLRPSVRPSVGPSLVVPTVEPTESPSVSPTESPSNDSRRKLSSKTSCLGGFFISLAKDGATSNKMALNYFPQAHSGFSFLSANQTLPVDNAWTHVIMTKENNLIAYYINGVKTLSHSFASSAAEIEYSETLPLILGARNRGHTTPASNLTNFFAGTIDDMFIYNRVLPPSDMYDLFKFDAPTSQPSTQPSRLPTSQPSGQPTVRVDNTLNRNLIAFLPFDGNVYDNTNNKNHGVNVGAKLVTDRYGFKNSAYSFDGVSSYIYFQGKPFNFAARMTISFWVKPSPIQNIRSTIMDKRSILSNVLNSGWFIGQNDSNVNEYLFNFVNQTTQLDSPLVKDINLEPNVWSHVVIIKSTTEIIYYINGEKVCTKLCSAEFAQGLEFNAPLVLGATNTDSALIPSQLTGFFNGSLDDLFFYNRNITEDEVMRLYLFDVPTSQPSSQPTRQPSSQPSRQPTSKPTGQPSRQPTSRPSGQPSRQPTSQPSVQPTNHPSGQPSRQPTSKPTGQPSCQPSSRPSFQPTSRPSGQPSRMPTGQPSRQPTSRPSGQPSRQPTSQPSVQPTNQPSGQPSRQPTSKPTGQPSCQPSSRPSFQPTSRPSGQPSRQPTSRPSRQPTGQPTGYPSFQPTGSPTEQPTSQPSSKPSAQPTGFPSGEPTTLPSSRPSSQPSGLPSRSPTNCPSSVPTMIPTCIPSSQPSSAPSYATRPPTFSPTDAPTAEPTEAPTEVPTEVPTCIPTAIPSVLPTEMPSVLPTYEPSSAPSGFPSSMPSSVPSSVPTSGPTAFPSSRPSSVPSSAPTSGPTAVPSSRPSSVPSSSPTSGPTVFPSSRPSAVPSARPTRVPSGVPTAKPSCRPTSDPSNIPTKIPTETPTMTPTAVPSELPTVLPTVTPTDLPTVDPTSGPTEIPTFNPSKVPSYVPTAIPSYVPSRAPTAGPTRVPSAIPTEMPSVNPTFVPTQLPSAVPTVTPSVLPTMNPTWLPTEVPTYRPSMVPSHTPSEIPTVTPTTVPTAEPTVLPTVVPTFVPSVIPTVNPTMKPTSAPSIASINAFLMGSSPSQNLIVVQFARSLGIYGGIFPKEGDLSAVSIPAVVHQNVKDITAGNLTTLTFANLIPAYEYSVYFVYRALTNSSSMSALLHSRINVSTLCCRTIEIKPQASTILEENSYLKFITLQITGVPVKGLGLTFQLRNELSTSFESFLVPSSFNYPRLSTLPTYLTSKTEYISLNGLTPGNYTLSVSVSGDGASNYAVRFTNGMTTFSLKVLAKTAPLPAPNLISAAFQNDGTSMKVTFDAASNRGGFSDNVQFSCSQLLNFPCANRSSCQWTDEFTIASSIYTSNDCASPGNYVSLSSLAQIKAMCPSNTPCTNYNLWPKSSTSIQVKIAAPAVPSLPTVVLALPSVISSCSNLLFDLTSSTGNFGRSWKNISVEVQTTPAASTVALVNTINQRYGTYPIQLTPPFTVRSTFLKENVEYTFHVRMCNYLGFCGVANRVVKVISTIIPVVTIIGNDPTYITRAQPLSLISNVQIQSCNGTSVNPNALSYLWTISNSSNAVQTSLISQSKDLTRFLLSAYALQPNQIYFVALKVSYLSNVASADVEVVVNRGKLVAVIGGGLQQSMRVSESKFLDASQSYDEDLPTVTGSNAGLLFTWSCMQVQPVLNTSCASLFNANPFKTPVTSRSLTLQAKSDVPNTVAQLTVVVTDTKTQRTSTSSVQINILPSIYPTVTLYSATTKVNPSQSLKLIGIINLPSKMKGNATWINKNLDLTKVTSTPITQLFSGDSLSVSIYFSVNGNALIAGSTYSFGLKCLLSNGIQSTNSISILVNSPPTPGTFQLDPTSGEEASTPFSFQCNNWVDSDLPLTYQFGYLSSTGTANVVRTLSQLPYTSTVLPAGLKSNNEMITCTADIYDSLRANSSVINKVKVTASTATNLSALITSNLNSKTSVSVDDLVRVTTLVSSLLNKANCSHAPNCSDLHRSPCSTTSHSCGSCLPSYFSTSSGDGNDQCYQQLPPISVNPKLCNFNCSSHGQCVYYSFTSGNRIDRCYQGDLSCYSACDCSLGYRLSTFCEVSDEQMQERIKLRDQVVEGILNYASQQDDSEQVVSGWMNSIVEVSQVPNQLSENSVVMLLELSNHALLTVSSQGYSAVATLTSFLDGMDALSTTLPSFNGTIRRNVANSRRRLGSGNNDQDITASSIHNSLKDYTTLVLKEMVPGEDAVENIKNNFRMHVENIVLDSTSTSTRRRRMTSSASGCSSTASITMPTTSLENTLNHQTTQLTVPACPSSENQSSLSFAAISLSSSLYSHSGFVSNPVSLVFSSNPCSPGDTSSSCTTQFTTASNNAGMGIILDSVNKSIECLASDRSSHFITCPNEKEYNVSCRGRAETIIFHCPSVARSPVCDGLMGTQAYENGCAVVSYGPNNITCSCPITHAGTTSAISSSSTGVEVSYVTLLTTTEKTFTSTIVSAQDLNVNTLKKSWQVIITIGALLIGMVMTMLYSHYADKKARGKISTEEKLLNQAKLHSSVYQQNLVQQRNRNETETRTMIEIAEEALPKILNSQSLSTRIWNEEKRFHKYLGIFCHFSLQFPRILRVVSLSTNVIIMLFIQSLTYNFTHGNDGTCEKLQTAENCLAPKSDYGTGSTKCYWQSDSTATVETETGTCHFLQPENNIEIILFVAIFSALVSIPLAIFVDYLINYILSAPDSQSNIDMVSNNKAESKLMSVMPSGRSSAFLSADDHHLSTHGEERKERFRSVFKSVRKTFVRTRNATEQYGLNIEVDYEHILQDLIQYRKGIQDEVHRAEIDRKFSFVSFWCFSLSKMIFCFSFQ
jgi:hypothetical protein